MNYFDMKRKEMIYEKIGLKLIKFAKNKINICIYAIGVNEQSILGNLVGAFMGTKINGKCVDVFSDYENSFDELKDKYDMIIITRHVPCCKKNDIAFKALSTQLFEILYCTENEKFSSEDYDFMFSNFVDELYDIIVEQKDDKNMMKKVIKKKYKNLLK